MKRLMFLISTEGKTTEQVTKQAWEAWQKYQRVARESIQQLLTEGKITQEQADLELNQLSQVQPQVPPVTTPPVNTPRLSTEEFWRRADTTSQHLGGVTQITNYPHPRNPQSTEKQIKPSNSSEIPVKK